MMQLVCFIAVAFVVLASEVRSFGFGSEPGIELGEDENMVEWSDFTQDEVTAAESLNITNDDFLGNRSDPIEASEVNLDEETDEYPLNTQEELQAAKDITNTNNEDFLVNGTDPIEKSEVNYNESMREIVKSHHTWPNGIVHYRINQAFNHDDRAKILRGLMDIEEKTCIKFIYKREKDGVKNWVNVVKADGCQSAIGMQQGGYPGYSGQSLSLGKGCVTPGITIHEFMHALGFSHEQTRPDRDDYVDIHTENIKGGPKGDIALSNFAKNRFASDTLNQPYDYFSIMHYGMTYFSKNRRPTITPKDTPYYKEFTDSSLGPNCRKIGQRCTMSGIDVLQIKSLYRCPEGSQGSSHGHGHCNGGDDCCGKDGYKCGKGEGDCDSHSDCQQGLVCGSNNCARGEIWTRFDKRDDCCTERCEGGDDCCGKDGHKCGKGEGDCDNDDDCQTGLKCGTNNCKGPTFNHGFLNADDCCTDEG